VLPALDCCAGLEGWPAALEGWPPDCGWACSAITPQDVSATISSAAAAIGRTWPDTFLFPMTPA
jgi:hypothetical protein